MDDKDQTIANVSSVETPGPNLETSTDGRPASLSGFPLLGGLWSSIGMLVCAGSAIGVFKILVMAKLASSGSALIAIGIFASFGFLLIVVGNGLRQQRMRSIIFAKWTHFTLAICAVLGLFAALFQLEWGGAVITLLFGALNIAVFQRLRRRQLNDEP